MAWSLLDSILQLATKCRVRSSLPSADGPSVGAFWKKVRLRDLRNCLASGKSAVCGLVLTRLSSRSTVRPWSPSTAEKGVLCRLTDFGPVDARLVDCRALARGTARSFRG